MRICPYCKEEIPEDASVCPICNENLNKVETKKCPYCFEEIPTNTKVCPACGEQLKKNVKIQIDKKILIMLASLIFIFLVILGTIGSFLILEYGAYKETVLRFTISQKDTIKNYNLLYDTLSEINNKEKFFKEYISKKHLQKNKDMAFNAFYNMLLESASIFNEVNWNYEYDEQISYFNPTLEKGDWDIFGYEIERSIKVVPLMKKDEYGEHIDEVKITSPKVPYIKLVYCGEGLIGAEVDYNYLYETYSKYLSAPWSDFLKIKAKEQKDMNGGSYYQDAALTPSMHNLMEWIMAWQDFRQKYPKFMSDKIEEYLVRYTSDFMSNLYGTFNLLDEKLYPEAQKAYEEFLKKVNPNSKEYKAVDKCYTVLKEHNFKRTNEFSVCISEWSNEDDYWEWR